MNKADALIDIIRDAQSDRASPTSYKRVRRALKALGLDAADEQSVLMYLCYYNVHGQPYPKYVQAVRS